MYLHSFNKFVYFDLSIISGIVTLRGRYERCSQFVDSTNCKQFCNYDGCDNNSKRNSCIFAFKIYRRVPVIYLDIRAFTSWPNICVLFRFFHSTAPITTHTTLCLSGVYFLSW